MRTYFLLIVAACTAVLTCSCSKDGSTETVYVDRVDTIYINNGGRDTVKVPEYIYIHDTIKIQVPEYIYRTDTLYVSQTDTLYMSQDGRQIPVNMQTYINDNWFYILDRMSTAFTTDGATRVYLFVSKYIFHMADTNSNDMIVAIATKDGVLNSVVYFGIDQAIGGNQYGNPYGWKYTFPTGFISGLNASFFDSLLIGIYTTTPGYYPFQ
jgi:hypothetical protein